VHRRYPDLNPQYNNFVLIYDGVHPVLQFCS
jgi:hypothetical protein